MGSTYPLLQEVMEWRRGYVGRAHEQAWTIREVSYILASPRDAVVRLLVTGRLAFVRERGNRRILDADLEAYFNTMRVG